MITIDELYFVLKEYFCNTRYEVGIYFFMGVKYVRIYLGIRYVDISIKQNIIEMTLRISSTRIEIGGMLIPDYLFNNICDLVDRINELMK